MINTSFSDTNRNFEEIAIKLEECKANNQNCWITTDFSLVSKWGYFWRFLSGLFSLGMNPLLSHVKIENVAQSLFEKCLNESCDRLLTRSGLESANKILNLLDDLSKQKHQKALEKYKEKLQVLLVQTEDHQVVTQQFNDNLASINTGKAWLNVHLNSVEKYPLYQRWLGKISNVIPFHDYFAPFRCVNVVQVIFHECKFLSDHYLFSQAGKDTALAILEKLNDLTHKKWDKTVQAFINSIQNLKLLFETKEKLEERLEAIANTLENDREQWLNTDLTFEPRWGRVRQFFSNKESKEAVNIIRVANALFSECEFYSKNNLFSQLARANVLRIFGNLIGRSKREGLVSIRGEIEALEYPLIEKPKTETPEPEAPQKAPPAPPPPPPPAPKPKEVKSKYLVQTLPKIVPHKSWIEETRELDAVRAQSLELKLKIQTNLKPDYSQAVLLDYLRRLGYENTYFNHFFIWLVSEDLTNKSAVTTHLKTKLLNKFVQETKSSAQFLQLAFFDKPQKSINDLIIEKIENKYAEKFKQLVIQKLCTDTSLSQRAVSALWYSPGSVRTTLLHSKSYAKDLLNDVTTEIVIEELKESAGQDCIDNWSNISSKIIKEQFENAGEDVIKAILATIPSTEHSLIEESFFGPVDKPQNEGFWEKNSICITDDKFITLQNDLIQKKKKAVLDILGIINEKKNLFKDKDKLTKKLCEKTTLSKDEVKLLWFTPLSSFEYQKEFDKSIKERKLGYVAAEKENLKESILNVIADSVSKYPYLYPHEFGDDLPKIINTISLLVLSRKARNKTLSPLSPGNFDEILLIMEKDLAGDFDDAEATDILKRYYDNSIFKKLCEDLNANFKKYYENLIHDLDKSFNDIVKNELFKKKTLANQDKVEHELRLLKLYLGLSPEVVKELYSKNGSKYQACTFLSEYSLEHGTKLKNLKMEIFKEHFKDELPQIYNEAASEMGFKNFEGLDEADMSKPLLELASGDFEGLTLESIEAKVIDDLVTYLKEQVGESEEATMYAKGLWYSFNGLNKDKISKKLGITKEEAEKYMFR